MLKQSTQVTLFACLQACSSATDTSETSGATTGPVPVLARGAGTTGVLQSDRLLGAGAVTANTATGEAIVRIPVGTGAVTLVHRSHLDSAALPAGDFEIDVGFPRASRSAGGDVTLTWADGYTETHVKAGAAFQLPAQARVRELLEVGAGELRLCEPTNDPTCATSFVRLVQVGSSLVASERIDAGGNRAVGIARNAAGQPTSIEFPTTYPGQAIVCSYQDNKIAFIADPLFGVAGGTWTLAYEGNLLASITHPSQTPGGSAPSTIIARGMLPTGQYEIARITTMGIGMTIQYYDSADAVSALVPDSAPGLALAYQGSSADVAQVIASRGVGGSDRLVYVKTASDPAPQVRIETPANGISTYYTRDARGNLVEVKSDGRTHSYVFDARDNAVRYTDPNGRVVWQATYDADDRIAAQTDSAGVTWSYVWAGKGIASASRSGMTWSYGLDNYGTVTSRSLNGVLLQTYNYDAANRLLSVVDAQAGVTLASYAYNDPQRPRLRTAMTNELGDTTTIAYVGASIPASQSGPYGTTTFDHNRWGQATAIASTVPGGGPTYTLNRAVNSYGQTTGYGLDTPSPQNRAFVYDDVQRVTNTLVNSTATHGNLIWANLATAIPTSCGALTSADWTRLGLVDMGSGCGPTGTGSSGSGSAGSGSSGSGSNGGV